jgi:hypothetical protein
VAKKSLPNGHLSEFPNGDVETSKNETSDEKSDITAKLEDVKEAVVDKAEKTIGQKGKDTPKPEYAPNGYAHAPYWPLVSPS